MLETIITQEELFERWDEIARGLNLMIKKTGNHGQTPELVMNQMMNLVGKPNGFLLVNINEKNRLDGILFAVAILGFGDPSVEVSALWSRPGVATTVMYGGFDMLAVWAKGLGATRILAAITRSPDLFFEMFHKKLGFEKIGIIVERRL